MKGNEIAKKLNISTSALKHYEAWGLVPKVERAENGYRIYTQEHEAYFQCIRALNTGFGMNLVKKVMPLIIKGENITALWIINKAQVDLQEEKLTAERTVEMLGLNEFIQIEEKRNQKNTFTIGEVAKKANVSASAIRHWEKENLINPIRNKESGFRMYSYSDLRKVLVIRIVQKAVYSLDIVRKILSEIDTNNLSQAKKIAQNSLKYIDNTLVEHIRGIASLHHLLNVIQKKTTDK
ncbi:MerR family transcriptional regulator [Cytobacillus purgationiresistens]|uniref:DNA-binding transcriptional MerR regulator n=1 Tax=Cytobacillus purgationiresistens TaxID=863449 RepID=A0ABU0ASA1_9BACI|nr:MerR family transcriptional regulator [Cytobacillus purgationiresistens]MDQ0273754.1 DNA-binding transcriptional MerR regulator [Cytobacillus purgationiresistens]